MKRPHLTIIVIILVVLYSIGQNIHSKAIDNPLNSVKERPVNQISLPEAKAIFNLAFNDRNGAHQRTSDVQIQNHQIKKLVTVFKRKDDQETRFYLGRMLCISTYQWGLGPQSQVQRLNTFLEGYLMIEKLASENYTPAQFYLGAVTLVPSGMFGYVHLDQLRFPRNVPGTDGVQKICNRLLFDKEYVAYWNTENNHGNKYSKMRNIQRNLYLDICPSSNGYGPSYSQAIIYLEKAGNDGIDEAWTLLDTYFSWTIEQCQYLEDDSLSLVKSRAAYYKNKCKVLKNGKAGVSS